MKQQQVNNRNVLTRVAGLKPGYSMFDLSYEKKFTCEMGELIPSMCDEVVPGDIFKIGNQSIIRMLPMVAPVLHRIDVYGHYFFVPYRILWNAKTRELLEETGDWEDFISGGEDGDNADVLPRWTPTTYDKYSLWDYLGFPIDIDCDGAYPMDFPRRAYNMIWNEYYRDESLQDLSTLDNEDILHVCWSKDFFTSALPWMQRGDAPALPITGTGSAVWTVDAPISGSAEWPAYSSSNQATMYHNYSTQVPYDVGTESVLENNTLNGDVPIAGLNNNTIDFSTASTFDVADLRLTVQIQKWLERNARCGVRHVEFLRAHFGVSPRDERLQRPEYIGGFKTPIIVSEVLQTSESNTTDQGNMAGHGIGIADKYVGKYRVQEFGLIMGMFFIRPRGEYSQGINRQWLRESKYDFYFPEFANLSEQPIMNAEICAVDGDDVHNPDIFGYQGRYNEMRIKNSLICADMRDTFDYWHCGRQFNPAAPPSLNSAFVTCDPRRDIFADQDDPGFMVSVGNLIKAFRPMPITAEPGL